MRTNRNGRTLTLALLLAALAADARAQAPTETPPVKPATSTAPAQSTGATRTPSSMAAKPAGATELPATAAAHSTTQAKKPGQEGVTMHGHWTIDLRNADGTIAEHRDFENALQNSTFLYQLVTGQYVSGDLGITIASTGAPVCNAGTGASGLGGCLVAASSTAGLGGFTGCSGFAAGTCNYTLKENVNGVTYAITLAGTMPVLSSGAVTEVGTEAFICNSGGTGTYSTIDPVGCYNGTEGGGYSWGPLTGTTITALNVTAGQTLSFTVVLTFT